MDLLVLADVVVVVVVVVVIAVDDGRQEAWVDPGVLFRQEELHAQEPKALAQCGQEGVLGQDHEGQVHRVRVEEHGHLDVRHSLDRVGSDHRDQVVLALFHLYHVPVQLLFHVVALVPIQVEATKVSHPEPGSVSTLKMAVCTRKQRSRDEKTTTT